MKYIMRISDGVCFSFSSHGHLDSNPKYRVLDDEAAAGPTVAEPVAQDVVLLHAVHAVPVDQWSKPTGGRPAMPKVADVSAIAGCKVTTEEILSVLNQTK